MSKADASLLLRKEATANQLLGVMRKATRTEDILLAASLKKCMRYRDMSFKAWLLITLISMGLIFVLDCMAPLGVAVWMGYAAVMLVTLWSPKGSAPWLVAGASALLLGLGYLISPPGISHSVAIINRSLFMAFLAVMAAVVYDFLRRGIPEKDFARSRHVAVAPSLVLSVILPSGLLLMVSGILLWQLRSLLQGLEPFAFANEVIETARFAQGAVLTSFLTLGGIVGVVVYRQVRQVSEHLEMERILRHREDQLDRADVGYWQWDVGGNRFEWSPSCQRLFHFPGQEPMSYARFIAAVYPDDGPMVDNAFRSCVESRVHKEFDIEYRIQWSTGTVRWIHAKGTTVCEAGLAIRMAGIAIDITERRTAEQALREREEYNRRIIESSHDCISVLDLQGRLLEMSEGGQRLLDIDDIGPYLYRTWTDLWSGEERHAAEAAVTAAAAGHSDRFTGCLPAQTGTPKWWDVIITPIWGHDGMPVKLLAVARDITDARIVEGERRQAEQAVRQSEARLRAILDRSPAAIFIKDRDGHNIFMNEQCASMLGTGVAEGTGKTDHELLTTPIADQLRSNDLAIWDSGIPTTVEEDIPVRDAVHTFLSHKFLLREEEGVPYALCGIATDITKLKRQEEELRRWNDELESRVTERTHKLLVSQERLRSLAAELNLAEQRERRRLAAELHDHLQQLLVFSKIKLGQAKQLTRADTVCGDMISRVDDVLSDALSYTRTLVAELSPTVLRDHGLAAGLTWLGDYMKKYDMRVNVTVPQEEQELTLPEEHVLLLFQSVRELLMNSWKHAGTGRATVTMERHPRALVIAVNDHGKGFDVQASGAANGLSSKFGLFSIRERMNAIGGSFVIESTPGGGTTCVLQVPLSDAAEHRPVSQSSEVRGVKTDAVRTSEAIGVLLVDDHAMVRQGLRSVLEGFPDVIVLGEAADGEAAVRAAKELQPSVVIMDINMPRMNGIEATARIKALYPDMVVIGLSVNAEENHDAMRKAGAKLLLTKEAAVDQLYTAIQQAVNE